MKTAIASTLMLSSYVTYAARAFAKCEFDTLDYTGTVLFKHVEGRGDLKVHGIITKTTIDVDPINPDGKCAFEKRYLGITEG